MPAVNQIISEAAKIRYRSNNDWSCPMVIRAPYGGGVHGALISFPIGGGYICQSTRIKNSDAIHSLRCERIAKSRDS